MTVKVLLLKSGEQIIADVNGMFRGEELVKYQLIKPCQVIINGEFRVTEPHEDVTENQMSVSLYPWPALTEDEKIEIFCDWAVTMVNPNGNLKEMYETQVLKNDRREERTEIDQSNSTDEQSVIDQ